MEAYGTADGERMKFTGHELDGMGTAAPADDLYNMHARYYNPNIARFISADLLRGDPHSPQSFNLFAYVGGNPMTFVDPSGLQTLNGDAGGPTFALFFDAISYGSFSTAAPPDMMLPGQIPLFGDPGVMVFPGNVPSTFAWGTASDPWGWQNANEAAGGGVSGVIGGSSGGGGGGYSGSGSILSYISLGDLVSWQATRTGALAWADGVNPFGNPLAKAGFYDTNFPGAQTSSVIGSLTRDVELTIAMSAGVSRLPAMVGKTSWFSPGGLVNSNRYLRIGWGRFGGDRMFRVAGDLVRWLSKNGKIDFWNGGPQ